MYPKNTTVDDLYLCTYMYMHFEVKFDNYDNLHSFYYATGFCVFCSAELAALF